MRSPPPCTCALPSGLSREGVHCGAVDGTLGAGGVGADSEVSITCGVVPFWGSCVVVRPCPALSACFPAAVAGAGGADGLNGVCEQGGLGPSRGAMETSAEWPPWAEILSLPLFPSV